LSQTDILIQHLKSTDYGRTRHSKNRQTIIKALAAFAEDCLSLRSKRVPQALQVPAYLIHLPFIFCWSEGFLVTFCPTKSNMNKKLNKNIIKYIQRRNVNKKQIKQKTTSKIFACCSLL